MLTDPEKRTSENKEEPLQKDLRQGSSGPKWLTTRTMATVAMMCAISTVLGFFPEIPMTFFAPWLKLDFAYLPMLLTGFSMGFVPGLIVLVVKNFFQLVTTNSAGAGQAADMIMGICMLLPATLIYKINRTRTGALIGMICGILAMTAGALLSNWYILLPVFLGDGFHSYMDSHPMLLWAAVVPFNLIKGTAVCLITFLLYKPLSPLLKKGMKA
ncbi:MAG: hypothetical protein CW338_05185 [Clostridiales bacterium]|nr:hypothetical protein [Clostridiales bacterium]